MTALEIEYWKFKEALEKIAHPDCGIFRAGDGHLSYDAGEPARIAREALGIETEQDTWRKELELNGPHRQAL